MRPDELKSPRLSWVSELASYHRDALAERKKSLKRNKEGEGGLIGKEKINYYKGCTRRVSGPLY